jgi:hypothetical protein
MGIWPTIKIKESNMLIPQVHKQVFHEDIMYLIRKEIAFLKSGKDSKVGVDDKEFFRLYHHNDPFFKQIHHMITDRVSALVGEAIRPSYCFTSMYFVGQGQCPEHVDRPQCKYTLDLCVNQNEPWPIKVAGRDYLLNEGDALVFSGTDHIHSRPPMQPNNYCDLVFFHFVPIGFTGDLN